MANHDAVLVADADVEKQTVDVSHDNTLPRDGQISNGDTDHDATDHFNSGLSDQAQTPSPVDEKGDGRKTLQDQTNLLPFRQLILVFVGLGCAVFCEYSDRNLVLLIAY